MMFIASFVILAVIASGLMLAGIYNGLVTRRNRYRNAYAQIDVQLKRRYDLIPNLVETVKRYLSHEAGTLEAVVRARNTASSAAQRAAEHAGDPGTMKSLAAAEAALRTGLTHILALSESYPELKGDANMRELAEELTSTENRVAFARQAYNDCVTSYNDAREAFPALLVAGAFGFNPAGLLDVISAPVERDAPKVAFAE
jgi:LemA protein